MFLADSRRHRARPASRPRPNPLTAPGEEITSVQHDPRHPYYGDTLRTFPKGHEPTRDTLFNTAWLPNQAAAKRGGDALSINIPTQAYRNAKGKRRIDVCVRFDAQHNCLVMESRGAFDTRQTAHKRAVIDCVLEAASRTPFGTTIWRRSTGGPSLN